MLFRSLAEDSKPVVLVAALVERQVRTDHFLALVDQKSTRYLVIARAWFVCDQLLGVKIEVAAG